MAQDMTDLPVVAHVMRGYLARTETFIGNQIYTLQGFKPIILCHHRCEEHSYPFKDVVSADDVLKTPWKHLDILAYRAARCCTPWFENALVENLQEHNAKLLHYHYLVDARYFVGLKRKTDLPAIVSGYGYDISSFPLLYGGYGRHYLKPLFTYMDCLIAMSNDMRNDLIALGCPQDKILVHYYGTDCSRFDFPQRKYSDKDSMNIFVCGTLEIKKAQHLVLRALRQVEQNRLTQKNFTVTLVGDGPMRDNLRHQVLEYGWQDRVRFAGYVPHHEQALLDAYRQADIFSLPSITVKCDKEGIPGTIVEAMASGLPVVSTYHAGIPEIIESEKEGILVREGDVDAMARAFADLINQSTLREKLGRAAALRAQTQLDIHARTRNLESIYHRFIGDN